MVKVHGAVYVLLAIFIWIYTQFIEGKIQGDSNVWMFKWVALLFIIWGAIRLYQDFPFYRGLKKEEHGPPRRAHHHPNNLHNTHGSPHQSHQHIRNPHGSPQQTHGHTRPHLHPSGQQAVIRCPRCHNLLPARAHFCQYCQARR